MDFYLFSLLLGFCGLLVMAFSGVAGHGHGGHSHGGHGHGGHDVGDVNVHGHVGAGGHAAGHLAAGSHGAAHAGHAGAAHGHAGHGHAADGHAHAGHGHAAGHGHGHASIQETIGSWFVSFLSPRVLFSVLVGIGAVGLLGREWIAGPLLAVLAVIGGIAFEKLMVQPVWNLLFRFASEPAHTLESALYDRATAVTGFDANGQGLVKIELDGQVVQLLATLRPEDRAIRVHAGDELLVEDVDGGRNRCVVSRAGAPALPGGR